MDPNARRDLQILVTSGPECPEKAVLAAASALSAAHSDLRVSLVLAMRGAIWAAGSEGNEALVPGYPPMGELIALVHEAGGEVLGCSSCIDQYCPAPRDDVTGQKILRPHIERAGLSTIVLRMTEARTVNF